MISERVSHYPAMPAPAAVPLTVLPEHDCPYLTGRRSMSRGFLAGQLSGEAYHRFMNAGFRRSGRLVYQPVCRGCRACMPLRVAVETFRPSKSQRRCRRRNADLHVSIDEPRPTDEKYDLYRRYVTKWHGRGRDDCDDEDDWATFQSFLYDSPVETLEFCYRDPAGRLLAVGICDVCPASLSSVYFYHDPAEFRRGLGTFGAMYEIETAQSASIPHYYLGYWIDGCGTMEYKSGFRPCELLHPDGAWRRVE